MHIPPAAPGARGKVWFVGAGPGDPELITLKGQRLLAQAGAVLFAGSLVNEAVTRFAPAGCEVRDSSRMALQEMTDWLTRQARRHATVVRLQTGDPALYGALIEMARPLSAAGIEWAVVPGVSSAMAAVAAAGESLTLPEVTQTVVLTRVAGGRRRPGGAGRAPLHAVHFFVHHLAAQGAGRLAAGRLGGRRAHAGGAQGQLGAARAHRARHAGRYQRALPPGGHRLASHDRGQPRAGRAALARSGAFAPV